ncbi:MAG: DUF6320 domain-containing protein [Suipraeoptans sp.]
MDTTTENESEKKFIRKKHKRERTWRKLDNAALLFSAANNSTDPRVFRFYCVLNEEIIEGALQKALDKTLERFPIFLRTMRMGLFWQYMEETALRPKVTREYKDPCLPIYIRDKKHLLFEVSYYKNRINLEVFHALTDGTGATEFIKELVKQYVLYASPDDSLIDHALGKEDITFADMEMDSFSKYFTHKKSKKKSKPKALQIRSAARRQPKMQLSEISLSVSDLLPKARELGVSMSVLITTLLMYAIHKEASSIQAEKPIRLMVPVNLRNFFESDSMLNFFGWIEPSHNFAQEPNMSFEEVLLKVKDYYKDSLTRDKMETHINEYTALEKHPILRFVPWSIKNIAIYLGSRKSALDISAIFSNMGSIRLPEEYEDYIEYFGVYTSTPKLELTMCSFKDNITLSFTSRFDSSNIVRNFTRELNELDVQTKEIEPNFPETDTPILKGLTIYKWFTFLCIISAIVSLSVNYLVSKGLYWSLISIAGIGCLWTVLSIGYYKRNNLLKATMWLYVLVSAGSVIWDLSFGFIGWSIDFVFPGMSLLVLTTMLIISKLQSHTIKECLIYYLMAAAFSFVVPSILLITGIAKNIYMSFSVSVVGLIVIIALVIFKWKDVKEEMGKKLRF